ncbi:transposable element Tcb2 transposase [Trichonephila clavipes]|nr:transposable element Tcb2 transposase [Trichonephila clavipes]
MRVWEQWINEHQTTRKTGSGRRKDPLTANNQRLRLQWAHEHRAWQDDWRQVVFSDETRFSLWDHDARFMLDTMRRAIFQLDNARPYVAKTVRDFCSGQYMQLLSWPAYLPDMSPIEHVWDSVGRHLARDSCPAASKDKLLLRIQAILNSPPQVDIQNLFDSMPRRVAALIAALGDYTRYWFRTLNIVSLL